MVIRDGERFQSSSAEETEAVAAALAARLQPGDVVLIEGELGAGKTTFVRGACRALGVNGAVTSPTFTIGQRYHGRVEVSHLDLYRVEDLDDEDPELLGDYLRPDTVAFIEWAGRGGDRAADFARVAARVRVIHSGRNQRTIEISR